MSLSTGSAELDLRGEVCPFTFIRSKLAMEQLPRGAVLRILIDHPAAAINVPRSLQQWGQRVVIVHDLGNGIWAIDAQRVD
jgi:tRNA 2-thiouridine synthesizing protein A